MLSSTFCFWRRCWGNRAVSLACTAAAVSAAAPCCSRMSRTTVRMFRFRSEFPGMVDAAARVLGLSPARCKHDQSTAHRPWQIARPQRSNNRPTTTNDQLISRNRNNNLARESHNTLCGRRSHFCERASRLRLCCWFVEAAACSACCWAAGWPINHNNHRTATQEHLTNKVQPVRNWALQIPCVASLPLCDIAIAILQ
jgi:hypothetical protein